MAPGTNKIKQELVKEDYVMDMMILEAVILACTLSVDAFIASFAYGSNRIKILFPTVLIISLVSSGILGIFLVLGGIVRPLLSATLSSILSFTVLFLIGMAKILDNVMKSVIRRTGSLSRNIHFSFLHLKFILNVYADPEIADVDNSKSISPLEACSLAIALSLDGMAAGFGAALGNVNGLAVILASFVTNGAAVLLGERIGNRMSAHLRFNISWLSGVVLMILAFTKLI